MATQFPIVIDGFVTRISGEYAGTQHLNNLLDAMMAMQRKVGKTGATDGTTLESKATPFFASGRKIWIYEGSSAMPYGWSIVAVYDALLAVKGGSTYTVGGATAGNWTIFKNMGMAHTHGVGSYTFNFYHVHYQQMTGGFNAYPSDPEYGSYGGLYTTPAGSSPQSIGGTSASDGTHNGLWRPAATVGIIIEKS